MGAYYLGLFFVSSSLLSHFKEDEKRTAAEKFDKGHQRDFAQAMANGGLGSLVALLSALVPSPIWFPVFIGVMGTVTADTWATELGTLAKNPPRLITTGDRLKWAPLAASRPLGTAVSLLGGLLIGLTAGLFDQEIVLWTAAIIGAVGGLAGSLFDSLLARPYSESTIAIIARKTPKRKLHKCGHETRPLRGWSWLNNDLVNLLASVVGGAIAASLVAVPELVACRQRSSSATLQAWAGHPRGVKGGSPSKISLTLPDAMVGQMVEKGLQEGPDLGRILIDPQMGRLKGPISQPQTVP